MHTVCLDFQFHHAMSASFIKTVASTAAFLLAVLLLDGPGPGRQMALGLATVAFLSLLVRAWRVPLLQVIVCIVVATIGEVILSLGWQLYSYRDSLIPLYVPPGHGVFYALAVITAQQPALRRHALEITNAILVSGSMVAIISVLFLGDVWGLLWWLAAGVLIRRSREPLLLSACFIYTMQLEWAGTALGNWRWAAEVPGLGVQSANPPAGVGILYILLDLIVVALTRKLAGTQKAHPPLQGTEERTPRAWRRRIRVHAEGVADHQARAAESQLPPASHRSLRSGEA